MTVIVAALGWSWRETEGDPLTGAVSADRRDRGPGQSELAALEHALRLGQRQDARVVAATVGPAEAEAMLRDALAAGAADALRVERRHAADVILVLLRCCHGRSPHLLVAAWVAVGAAAAVGRGVRRESEQPRLAVNQRHPIDAEYALHRGVLVKIVQQYPRHLAALARDDLAEHRLLVRRR